MRSARQQVQSPGVVEGELEPDSTLWCYCCQLEVARHVTDRLTTVVWGGLLEHMARCVCGGGCQHAHWELHYVRHPMYIL